MRGRILIIGVLSGLVGVAAIGVALAATSRSVLARNAHPLLGWLATPAERTRCAEGPTRFRGEGPGGVAVWAYDAVTLTSANPEAPALPLALTNGVRAAGHGLELRGLGRGALAARRLDERGPCAVWAAEMPPLVSRRGVYGFFALGGLLAGLFGAIIAAAASARPLRALAESRAELAEKHDQLRRQIADITHDVRTPIASLQLAIEQALSVELEADRNAHLMRAVHDVVYIGGLVSNLRLASELRAGADPSHGTARLAEAVSRVVTRAQSFARRKGVELDLAVPDGDVLVRAEPVALEQAVANLVDNAVTHVDPGCHVAVLLETRTNGTFTLTVVDDGPGVAPADLPRLGERTFRTTAARERDARGSGLGVAITSELCRRLGWALAFSLEEPRGLRATIEGRLLPPAAGHGREP